MAGALESYPEELAESRVVWLAGLALDVFLAQCQRGWTGVAPW